MQDSTSGPSPFELPSNTLAEAVTKAQAILKFWKANGKPWRDELDACFALACQPGNAKWGNGLNWRQLVAMVKDQPVPTA